MRPYNALECIPMGRGYVELGDTVKVKPSRPHRRDGFLARVKRIAAFEDGAIEVTVVGAPKDRPVALRTFTLDRLERVR